MPNLRWLCTPLPCALILCSVNTLKPPMIDDVAYLWYARQIQETPLEPFGPPPDGFRLIWYGESQGALSLLTPMVVPYWLALGIGCFGEHIVPLKLWLFPFCWLFTFALFALLRRFAPAWKHPLLVMTVTSPTFLPSVNLMIDLPAIALSLTAIVLFFRAIDRPTTNYFLVAAAGLVEAVAAQTKYNAAVATGAILWAAILHRRPSAGILAATLAVAGFAGWELYLKSVYGQSHFLLQVETHRQKPLAVDPHARSAEQPLAEIERVLVKKAGMITPLIGYLGGLLPALALLAGAALRFPARTIRAGACFVVVGFVLMAIVPNCWAVYSRDEKNREEVTLGAIFISICGITVVLALFGAMAYLGFRARSSRRRRLRADRGTWFLIGWAFLEIAGYFVLSPFPASRRVMSFVVAVTLIFGRLLTRTCRSAERQRRTRAPIALGILLGLFFFIVDTLDAQPDAEAPGELVEWIRRQPGGDRPIRFAGHWGLQYAAEQAGAKAIYPDEFAAESGDWLILPEGERPNSQRLPQVREIADLRLRAVWEIHSGLRTIPDYYGGYMPIRHHEGPRIIVGVWQVR